MASARDSNLGRDVAIKVLPESWATDEDRLARFRREAEVLASLNRPNIATIHGLEQSDGRALIVMELVEGPTLADTLNEGPIAPQVAMRIALQILAALEAAHARQIVHRDLKPENIKLRADNTVKVLDFGIAKHVDPLDIEFSTAAGFERRIPVQSRASSTHSFSACKQPIADLPTDLAFVFW